MGFIEKFTQDRNYRKIYGLGLPGDPAGKLYILEHLMPMVTDPETSVKLNNDYIRINKT